MLGLGTVFYFALLLINSIAILNEERFLSRGASLLTVGWSPNSVAIDQGFAGGDPGVKTRLVQLISAVRVLLRSACVLTVPLIIVNTIVIVYELVLG